MDGGCERNSSLLYKVAELGRVITVSLCCTTDYSPSSSSSARIPALPLLACLLRRMAGRTVEVMAAAGGAFFGRDQLAAAADGRAYYYGSSGHGAVLHHHHHFVQSGSMGGGSHDPAGGGVVAHEAGALAAGGGMAPASFAAAGYGGAAHVVLPVAAPAQAALHQPPAAVDGEAAAPFKGAWTKEEDEILREMVSVHGNRKWATIARHLPGRIGKQCRERWINHLHPGIKKDVWTEEEDMALIEAHRSCGNRWSVIARHLPGRSENSVKNHWNATKRGLKAKRRLRKRNSDPQAVPPPVPGQLSLLAEYIRSLCPDAANDGNSEAPPLPPPPVTSSAPASDDYAQEAASANPPPGRSTAGTYLDPAPAPMVDLGPYGAYGGGVPDGRYSYYLPPYAHMNLHYGPLQMAPPQQMVGGGAAQADHFHAAPYVVVEGMNDYLQQPFFGEQINLASNAGQEMEFDDRESSTNNQGGGYYGEAAAAGPSSGSGGNYPEEMEVVQMASREFAGRDQDGLTLDLTKFR